MIEHAAVEAAKKFAENEENRTDTRGVVKASRVFPVVSVFSVLMGIAMALLKLKQGGVMFYVLAAAFVPYRTSEIRYTLLMIAFLLLSLYFFSCTLRFRVMWDEEGIRIRQNWKPEKHYAWTELEQMYIEDQCIILYLDGKKYGFSQGCPNSMELIDFLEQKFSAEQAAE